MDNSPVEAAIAPMMTAGIARIIHPRPAAKDKIVDPRLVLCDNTRWKYTWKQFVHKYYMLLWL